MYSSAQLFSLFIGKKMGLSKKSKSKVSDTFITLISVFLGGIIGMGGTIYATHEDTIRVVSQEKRQKMEAIFESASDIVACIQNKANNIDKKYDFCSSNEKMSKLKALVDLYYPEHSKEALKFSAKLAILEGKMLLDCRMITPKVENIETAILFSKWSDCTNGILFQQDKPDDNLAILLENFKYTLRESFPKQ